MEVCLSTFAVITYLHAKMVGNRSWTDDIESQKIVWGRPGRYVEKSTLLSLGRSISEFELPLALYENTTFTTSNARTGAKKTLNYRYAFEVRSSSLRSLTTVAARSLQTSKSTNHIIIDSAFAIQVPLINSQPKQVKTVKRHRSITKDWDISGLA